MTYEFNVYGNIVMQTIIMNSYFTIATIYCGLLTLSLAYVIV